MKTLSFLASAVIILGVTTYASSVSSNGRTLTIDDAWRIHGGSNGKCKTSWGSCYADPTVCSVFNGQVCDQFVVYELIYGTGTTCEPNDPEDHCVEIGATDECLQYCHCTTAYNPETSEPETCLLIVGQGGWTLDSVTGPLGVEPNIGTDCPW